MLKANIIRLSANKERLQFNNYSTFPGLLGSGAKKNIRTGPIVLVTIVLLKDTQFGSDKSPIAITYYHIHIVLHITM